MARARLGGAAIRTNDHTVMTTIIVAINATRLPMIEKTVSSNGVSSLKWDSTPRHFCIEIRNTSPTEATDRVPRTSQPIHLRGRRNPMIQPSVTSAIPNESPNTTGLRHEMGPPQGPPSTRYTPRWTTPLKASKAPQT